MIFDGRILDWRFDPLEALRRWPLHCRAALLHSGRLHPRWSRWSILAQPQGAFQFLGSGAGRSRWRGAAPLELPSWTHRPFADLRALLKLRDPEGGEPLWIGHFSYDLARWIERLPTQATNDRHWPLIELGYCPGYLAYDGQTRQWLACGTWRDGGYPDLAALPPHDGEFHAANLTSVFNREDYERAVVRALDYIGAGDIFQVNLTQRLTADFHGHYPLAPRATFQRLAATSPAWYGAYIELAEPRSTQAPPEGEVPGEVPGEHPGGHPGGAPLVARVIASTSPELFLEMDAAGNVVTRPIKGTRPAQVDPEELRRSEKDTAELNMIVDLLRNDLGRVCAYGSVRVIEPRTIESHPTVHHGVATVSGQLHQNKDLVDLLRATLPGGSITGAPKVRAMQIIDELEPIRRGPYCGSIGLLSASRICLNIAIRTMLIELPAVRPAPASSACPELLREDHSEATTTPIAGLVPPVSMNVTPAGAMGDSGGPPRGRVDFSVGGGVVADSEPALEYQETLDKAAALLTALRLPFSAPGRAVPAGQTCREG